MHQTVVLEPGAHVGRDLLTGAGSVILAGQVARNVHAGSGTLRLDDGAVVGGNLTYSSDQTAQIAPGACDQGTIAHHAPPRLALTAIRSSRPPTVSASEHVYRTPIASATE